MNQSANTFDILSSKSSEKNSQKICFYSTQRSDTLWNFNHLQEFNHKKSNRLNTESYRSQKLDKANLSNDDNLNIKNNLKQIKKTILYYSSDERYKVYEKIQNYTALINKINQKPYYRLINNPILLHVKDILEKQTTQNSGYIQLVFEQINPLLMNENQINKYNSFSLIKMSIIKAQTKLINLAKDLGLEKYPIKFISQNTYFEINNNFQYNLNLQEEILVKYYFPIQQFNKIQNQQLILRNAINFGIQASRYIQKICYLQKNKFSSKQQFDFQKNEKLLKKSISCETFYQKSQRVSIQKNTIKDKICQKQDFDDRSSTQPSTIKNFISHNQINANNKSQRMNNHLRQTYLNQFKNLSYLSSNKDSHLIIDNKYNKKYQQNNVLRISSTQKRLRDSISQRSNYRKTQQFSYFQQNYCTSNNEMKINMRTKKIKNRKEQIKIFSDKCKQLRQQLSLRKY